MARLRVVYLVHCNSLRIVVDGDIYMPAKGKFDSGRCPATSGKIVNDNLALNIE